MKTARILAFSVVAVAVPGCGSIDYPAAEPRCSIPVFDLKARDGSGGSAEPLGSSARLVDEFAKAVAAKTESVTMGEMTTRAGWTGTWTQATSVGPLTTVADINKDVGTHLESSCIKGFPPKYNDSDRPSYRYTLFFDAGVPVQAVIWTAANPDLTISRPSITPDTELHYAHGEMWAE
ncbi:hypothetical protein ACWEQ0_22685 [Nocardia thailandica]